MWTITVGVEGRYSPGWQGADSGSYWGYPFPIFYFRRANAPEQFHSPYDGIGLAIIDTGTFKLGPVGHLRRKRKESDYTELNGLGDVDLAVEIGGYAEFWWTPWLRTRAEVTQGVHGHYGTVGYLSADVVVPAGPFQLSAGPRLTLESSGAVSPYFSITPTQSANTVALAPTNGLAPLPVYTAGGGVYSYGAGGQIKYRFSREWATHAFVEYERLQGDAANSPLVAQRGDPNQWTFGAGITYSFDIRGLW